MLNSVITFSNVTKKFFLQEDKTLKEFIPAIFLGKSWSKQLTVLNDLSFEIKRGETIGIVGKNGSGKSTLLKLIAQVTTPSRGKVIISDKVAPLIELGAGFHHELSGFENIFLNAAILGMNKQEIESQLESIIDFSELREFIHIPVKRYSTGMYMRLAFSIAIHTNAPILLIDEVLAVGDASFQEKCLDYLKEVKKSREKTIVFVSHNEEAVKSFCDRALLLHNGKIEVDGDPRKVFDSYHKQL